MDRRNERRRGWQNLTWWRWAAERVGDDVFWTWDIKDVTGILSYEGEMALLPLGGRC